MGLLFLVGTGFAEDLSHVDKMVESYVSKKQFMGSILAARGDQVLFNKGYGFANLEWDIPNTPATRFRIGSITKQFTAAAVLLLEERGKLKIEDPVSKYVPNLPSSWDKITIEQLLRHTSGIPNITSFPEFLKLMVFPMTPEQLVALFRDKPLAFTPGERGQYSSSGYLLLGFLIEKITGQRYEEFIQQNIFTPLGMKDSGYDSNSAIIPRRASGYSPGPNGPENTLFMHMSVAFSAAALYSTTGDLLRWQRVLLGGKLLSPASVTKMTTPSGKGTGLGVGIAMVMGRKKFVHDGEVPGFNANLAYFPDSKVTVVVLANLNGREIPLYIADSLAVAAHGEKAAQASDVKLPLSSQLLQQYVGVYQLSPGNYIVITAEKDQLKAEVSTSSGFLSAGSETRFFFKEADAHLEFRRDDQGHVTDLIFEKNENKTIAPRISEKVVARREIELSPKVLAHYAGRYRLPPEIDLLFSVEGNNLYMSPAQFPERRVRVFAESSTKFFIKEVDMQFEFVTDDRGAVTHVLGRIGPGGIRNIPRVD